MASSRWADGGRREEGSRFKVQGSRFRVQGKQAAAAGDLPVAPTGMGCARAEAQRGQAGGVIQLAGRWIGSSK